MNAVGILILSLGVWVVYSGFGGFNPLTTMLDILAKPGDAAKIIDKAKAEATADSQSLIGSFDSASALKNYVAGSKDVFDGANLFEGFKLGDDWATHAAKGEDKGGLDFPMPSGTTLRTPFDGVYTYASTSGGEGNTVTIVLDNGYKSVFKHVSRGLLVNGQKVKAGTAVALSGGGSGDPNPGDSTGAHLHWNMIGPNGHRVNPQDYYKAQNTSTLDILTGKG